MPAPKSGQRQRQVRLFGIALREHRKPAAYRTDARPEPDQLDRPDRCTYVSGKSTTRFSPGASVNGFSLGLVIRRFGIDFVVAGRDILHVGVFARVAAHEKRGVRRRRSNREMRRNRLQLEEQCLVSATSMDSSRVSVVKFALLAVMR